MARYVWMMCLATMCSTQAYCSYINNKSSNLWLAVFIVACSIPNTMLWVYVSKRSMNLILDGLIYDLIITLSYIVVFTLVGKADSFNYYHWAGVMLVVTGMILLHL